MDKITIIKHLYLEQYDYVYNFSATLINGTNLVLAVTQQNSMNTVYDKNITLITVADTKVQTHTSATSKPAATKVLTRRMLLAKLVGIISFIVVVAGSQVLNVVLNNTQVVVAATSNSHVSAIVTLRLKNKNTGKYITQGLKWEVFSTVSNKLIQSDESASLSVILDAGLYLAKVRYKGRIIESNFEVKNDKPVNINLTVDGDLPLTNRNAVVLKKSPVTSISDLPTIHIRRKETGSHEANPIKFNWDFCVKTINLYKLSRSKYPQIWSMQEKSLKEATPDFNLDRGIIAEPNWSSLTENYEDEYFSGNKYALYKKGSEYSISKNGSCSLIKKNYHTAVIDDGEFSYKINFKEKKAEKNISAVVLELEVKNMYKNMAKNNPLMTQAMGKKGSQQQQQSGQALDKLNQLTKVSSTETIAGEQCEFVAMGSFLGVRICYWKTMHEYPSVIKRKIVLKTTVDLKKSFNESAYFGKATIVAIVFKKNIVLDDKVFSVPPNINIKDYSKQRMRN